MKTVTLTSSSSTISSSSDRSETRDSCYFPGCRKDANCTCDICLASINATLDLVPSTTLSKIANPNPNFSQKSPIPFDSKILSTPISKNPKPISKNVERERREVGIGGFLIRLIFWLGSPILFNSRVLSKPISKNPKPISKNEERERRGMGIGGFLIRLILGLGLVLGVELGFSYGVSRVLKPELSAEMVRNVVEKSWVLRDFDGKLRFLQRELGGLVSGEVFDCGSNGSLWKINQDYLLLNSQCTLYKSAAEEVSLWGWPLQTAGLLTAGFSSRSFTILSGRVTEWSNGKASNLTVKTNQSWVHKRWSASVVQFDKNTWIVEYKRAQMIENTSLISAALEFLNFSLTKAISKIKQEFWFLPNFGSQYGINGDNVKVPT